MIARSTQTALLGLVALLALGMTVPADAQARGRESYSHGYSNERHGRDEHHERHERYEHPSYRGRGHYREYYAPRYYYYPYYPDVVVYPRPVPRSYYYAPVEPGYPREYGTVGIHLDYNILF